MKNKVINEDDLFYANAPCRSCPAHPFHCDSGEVKEVGLKMDRWIQLKNYVDKLKKDNGRLKRKMEYDQTMAYTRGRMIDELQEDLLIVEKALDKACMKIAYDSHDNDCGTGEFECPNIQYGFKCDRCERDIEECYGHSHECWKEWAENDID